MNRVPFTVYDFFAYLSAGSVVVATVDYLFGYRWLLRNELGAASTVFLVLASYVSGHVVAHFSAYLLETFLVRRVLKQPATTLLGHSPPRVLRNLFPGYYKPLPEPTQQRVRLQAQRRGFDGKDEALFLHAYSVVTKDDRAQQRLDEFRNLYGFSRNMAFVLVLAALLLAVGTAVRGDPPSYGWAVIGAAAGLTMLYRYLKFFRQFSFQLLITYAELDLPQPVSKTAAGGPSS